MVLKVSVASTESKIFSLSRRRLFLYRLILIRTMCLGEFEISMFG